LRAGGLPRAARGALAPAGAGAGRRCARRRRRRRAGGGGTARTSARPRLPAPGVANRRPVVRRDGPSEPRPSGSGASQHRSLACYDTQPDDRAETSVALARLLTAVKAAKCPRVLLFLDPRAAPGAEPMPHAELEAFFGDRRGAACFVSCSPGEQSPVSGSLKA